MSKCDAYCISPVVLDACFQVLAAAIPEDELQVLGRGIYLPTGIDSLRIYDQEQINGQGWGYACIRSGLDEDGAGISGNVFLLKDDGRVVLEASGLYLKRLDVDNLISQQDVDNWLYEVEWQPLSCSQQDRLSEQRGAWLIFVDDGGVGQNLKTFLEARGETCVLVFSAESYEVQASGQYQLNPSCPEDFKRLVEDVFGSTQVLCRGIVYLWGLAAHKEEPVLDAFLENVLESCAGVLYLVQTLACVDWHTPPRLWIVTSDVQLLAEDVKDVSVVQAPLWGLGRTIVHEYPELRCTLIDLSSTDTTSAVERLFCELWENDDEDQIVLRGDMRYVARLAQYKARARNDFSISSEGTYLVTGGLGGLGLTIAQWLVKRGARHLVLLGRGKGSPSAHETLRTLQTTGSHIIPRQVDVTQAQQVANTLADIDRSMPPLRGIFHLAGVLDDAILLQLNRERLESVMASKVSGSWVLHKLTLEKELDFFVLFSSATSVLGSPGQGNYVAANAFLDALAHYRRTLGKPALSINWGPWAKVGLVARSEREGWLALQGIGSINPDQGGEVLDRLLGQDVVQVSVMPVNWPQLFRRYPAMSQLPLLADFVYRKGDGLAAHSDWEKKRVQIRDMVFAAEPVERQQVLEAYLKDQLNNVLGAAMTKLDLHRPIQELGVDSLMAVKLKARIESDLGVVVPIVSFFKGVGIAQMASQVLGRMAEAKSNPVVLSSNQEGAEQLLAKIDKFSDEEVDALLCDLLDERGFSE
jgi:NADP-dependent 3-hydroxy acid dehydrogenase YdfG